MKNTSNHLVKAAMAALMIAAPAAIAGTAPAGKDVVAPAPAATPFVTGSLSLTVDTHFISYGQDVWGAGTAWDDPLFHPQLELVFDLGGGFSGILGTWWDVNDNAESSITNRVQEVDVWAGVAYATGDWKFTLLYQEWMYASQSERIVDFKVGYANFLNPNLTLHGRVDGAEPFDTGLVTVLGIAPGTKLGPVSLSFPVNVAADTDGFHGGDAGFSYVSAGIGASLPLTFMKGNWTLNAGVTYYHTEDNVIVTNPESDFVTGSLGLALAF